VAITHYAVVIGDTLLVGLLAGGSEEHCRQVLGEWLAEHPLQHGETAEVLRREIVIGPETALPEATQHLLSSPANAQRLALALEAPSGPRIHLREGLQ